MGEKGTVREKGTGGRNRGRERWKLEGEDRRDGKGRWGRRGRERGEGGR